MNIENATKKERVLGLTTLIQVFGFFVYYFYNQG